MLIFSIWVVLVSRNNAKFYSESIPKIFASFALDIYICNFSVHNLSCKASKILQTTLTRRLWYYFYLQAIRYAKNQQFLCQNLCCVAFISLSHCIQLSHCYRRPNRPSLFDGYVTPPSTIEEVLNGKISKTATNP